jgi:hypothetical protein
VQTDRLDNIIPPALPVQFVKLDVEGAEFQVLQGGVKTLTAGKPVLVFEHTPLAQRCYGVTSDLVYDLLTKECQLRISFMSQWLHHGPPLSREAFCAAVTEGQTLYFVAHP